MRSLATMLKWVGSSDRVMASKSGSLHKRFRNIPLAIRHIRWTCQTNQTHVMTQASLQFRSQRRDVFLPCVCPPAGPFCIGLPSVSHTSPILPVFFASTKKKISLSRVSSYTQKTFNQLLNIPTVEFKSAFHRSFTLRHRTSKPIISYTYSFLTSGVSISIWRVWEGRTGSGGSTGPRGSINSKQQRNLLETLFMC